MNEFALMNDAVASVKRVQLNNTEAAGEPFTLNNDCSANTLSKIALLEFLTEQIEWSWMDEGIKGVVHRNNSLSTPHYVGGGGEASPDIPIRLGTASFTQCFNPKSPLP